MTTYRIQMMNRADMDEYLSGGYNYNVIEVYVDAETPQDALAKAQAAYPDMVLNQHPKSKEDVEAEEAARAALREAERAKEAAKIARRAAREAAKAAELGLSVPEYAERKKLEAKARRYMREAEGMQAQIENLQNEIAWRKKRAAEIEKELGL